MIARLGADRRGRDGLLRLLRPRLGRSRRCSRSPRGRPWPRSSCRVTFVVEVVGHACDVFEAARFRGRRELDRCGSHAASALRSISALTWPLQRANRGAGSVGATDDLVARRAMSSMRGWYDFATSGAVFLRRGRDRWSSRSPPISEWHDDAKQHGSDHGSAGCCSGCVGACKGWGVVAPRAAVGVDLVDVRQERRVVRVVAERRRVRDDEQEPPRAGQRDVHPPRVREKADLAGVVRRAPRSTITASFSRPWKPSTVPISRPAARSARSSSRSRRACAEYAAMIASSVGGRPRDNRRRASAATRSALPGLNVLGSNWNAGSVVERAAGIEVGAVLEPVLAGGVDEPQRPRPQRIGRRRRDRRACGAATAGAARSRPSYIARDGNVMICACMRCCCSSITAGRRRRAARRSSSRAWPRRPGRRSRPGRAGADRRRARRPSRARARTSSSGSGAWVASSMTTQSNTVVAEHRAESQPTQVASTTSARSTIARSALAISRAASRSSARASAHSSLRLGAALADAGLAQRRARSRHSRASSVAPSASTCASSVSATSAGRHARRVAEPHRAQPGAGEPHRRGCRPRCSTAPRTARARRARRAGARPRPACGSCRCRAGRGSARCRRAQRGVDRGALALVERVVERGPGHRRERPRRRAPARRRRGCARGREVASAALGARDRLVAAIERDLGRLGIDRVVAIELVDARDRASATASAPRGARRRRAPRRPRRGARAHSRIGSPGASRRLSRSIASGHRDRTRTRSPGADCSSTMRRSTSAMPSATRSTSVRPPRSSAILARAAVRSARQARGRARRASHARRPRAEGTSGRLAGLGPQCDAVQLGIMRLAMAESTAPERLIRKSTSIAQLLARRVQETPDREAYRYPVGEQWRSMTWRQSGERVKAIAAGLVVARPPSRGARRHPVQHARRVAARRPRRSCPPAARRRRCTRRAPPRSAPTSSPTPRPATRSSRTTSSSPSSLEHRAEMPELDEADPDRRRARRERQGLGDDARRARGRRRGAARRGSARGRRRRRRHQGRAPRDADLHVGHHRQAQGRAPAPRVLGVLRRRDRRRSGCGAPTTSSTCGCRCRTRSARC